MEVDPIVISPFELDPWDDGTIEPFTQTAYFSPIVKARRKFNASLLNSKRCDQAHFTVRLVQTANATEDVVWSAVIGLAEQFTAEELVSFPLYVLLNHADVWNNAGFTAWLNFFLFAPLVLVMTRTSLKACNVRVLELITFRNMRIVIFFDDWREVFYEIAIVSFIATALEMIVHLCIAIQGLTDVGGFFGGLGVALIPNGLGIALALNNWTALRYRRQLFVDNDWPETKSCSERWYKLSSNPWLAPLEIATGVSFLFLFGAGTFVGPAAIIIAGCIRFADLRYSKHVRFITTGYTQSINRSTRSGDTDTPGLFLRQ